ncbi:MAG: cation:proton antiporter, partial [Intestinibacter bartlettii]|uniref:cation:proton antiporter n=1 Tax=Intestinibacter bartlettii TaxID=261299 RepID=UPI0026EE34D8
MNSYYFLFEISLILFTTKLLGLLSRKIKLPQVVGALLAGIIIGPCVLNIVVENEFITQLSEIGVIFLMFIAGLETDIDALKKQGKASFVIALLGVLVPFVLGLGTTYLFGKFGMEEIMGNSNLFLESVFVGVILTATSVSITVETLREMGKLNSSVGNALLGAAIIDDI